MKIVNLKIENYKAIEKVEMKNLGQLVMIAGGNGVGKSCILDAIRIFKTSYGSYHQNEWQNFLNEFQINNQKENQLDSLFRNKKEPIIIELDIEISENERNFIENFGKQKISDSIRKSLTTQTNMPPVIETTTPYNRVNNSKFKELENEALIDFDKTIKNKVFNGKIELYFNNKIPEIKDNIILELLFSIYEPKTIGIIDFHGPDRNYQRENITNLNVDFNTFSEINKIHALYNSQNKYNNIKNEIATSYVKELIAKESGIENPDISSLEETLQELFRVFFPKKEFLGIKPTSEGTLKFPVKVSENLTHDINDLSSGEKEILFGYLRLRNSTPKNSVILIDEPELHLNPLIAQKLPDFYYKHIGTQCNNQIWLITHSETILKESYGNSNYNVFHLRPSDNNNENQACELKIDTEIESALIDLVGDLSTYKPDNKILILESENSEFDKSFLQKIFPEYCKEINIISAGSKSNVSNLHQILDKIQKEGIINKKIYSITDKDFNVSNLTHDKSFEWDVYHIENFLLEPKYIKEVIQDSSLNINIPSEEEILDELKKIAKESIDLLIRQTISNYVDNTLYNSGAKPKKNGDLSNSYHSLAVDVNKHITESLKMNLSIENLKKIETDSKTELESSFSSDKWIKIFKGREILKIYSSRNTNLRYIQFRNLIISKMSSDNYEPTGIKKILEQIIKD